MARCLFCQTKTGKRSNEHVFRQAFKRRFPQAPGLSFSWHAPNGELELVQRPISQFDMTLNAVCRECNQGWLERLENEATAVIQELTVGNTRPALSQREVGTLGFWAYVRALLLTHVFPRGHAPAVFFERACDTQGIPNGSYVSLAASIHPVFEAGAVQAATVSPGEYYLGFVGFGLGPLVFLVAISDASPAVSELAREFIEAPREWFPGAIRRLHPVELAPSLRLLTGEQAQLACLSMQLRVDAHMPLDQLGQPLDPHAVIPSHFHADLKVTGCARRPDDSVS